MYDVPCRFHYLYRSYRRQVDRQRSLYQSTPGYGIWRLCLPQIPSGEDTLVSSNRPERRTNQSEWKPGKNCWRKTKQIEKLNLGKKRSIKGILEAIAGTGDYSSIPELESSNQIPTPEPEIEQETAEEYNMEM